MRGTKQLNHILSKTLRIEIKKARNDASKWPDKSPNGVVEEFKKSKLEGWVSAKANEFPLKITLNVNGEPVQSTWADVDIKKTSWGKSRSFYLATKDIWEYCSKKDRLTIQVGEKILPIHEKGTYRRPGSNGTKTLEDLKNAFSKGYVFDRSGNLQLSKKLDIEWQNKIINLYKEITHVLEEKFEIEPFLIYGSLLGQVREGGFIGHDDDFDLAYLSKQRDGKKAALELKKIAVTLIKAGFYVNQKVTALHIHSPEDHSIKIDLFHIFFNEQDELLFPFGIAGTTKFMRHQWSGITSGMFANFPVKIPKNAETLVEHLYGSSWRTPIAGFNWSHARTTRAHAGDSTAESIQAVNQINKNAYREKIIKKYNITDSTKKISECADFVAAITLNNSKTASEIYNNLPQIDRKKVASIVNQTILYSKELEWTSHGVARTFRFWSEKEKVDYINHTTKLIEDLKPLSKDVCLGFGSVLAAVRNKDLIPHDDDMDIIIAFKKTRAATLPEARALIAEHLKDLKYSLHGDNFAHWQVQRDGYKMDVFAGIYNSDGTIGWYPGPRGKLKRADIFPAKQTEFLGVECPIPKKSSKYLEVTYGKDWTSPKPGHRHVWNQSAYKDLSGKE